MYNRESDTFYRKDSSSECFKIPDSSHNYSHFYSDVEADFNLDNFANEREYNDNTYCNFLSDNTFLEESRSFISLENFVLREISDDSMDNNQVKLEPFEQNIGQNNNNNGGENPLNSFVLDVSQIGKNNDENILDQPLMLNLSESVINNNNNEEEDNGIKKNSFDLINDFLEPDQSFCNSINYFFYGNNDQSKLSKNNNKNILIKNSQNSTKYQTNSNSFNKTNSLLSNTLINSLSFINLNKTNSHLSNAKMNLSSNSNLNIINSALLNIKRERESKSNSNKNKFITIQKKKYKRKIHTKYKDDNIFKKLKILCIKFIIKYLNDELKKNNSVDYGGKKYVNISNNTHSKSDYEALMKKTFKTILSGEASEEQTSKIITSEKISKKQTFEKTSSRKNIKKNFGGCSNQILINKINDLSERNQEFSNIVEILNINFKEFWKSVSDVEKIKKRENNLNKKDKFLKKLVEKFYLYINDNLKIKSKNPEDIKNYKTIFYNKMKEFYIKSYQRIRKKKDDFSTLKQKK